MFIQKRHRKKPKKCSLVVSTPLHVHLHLASLFFFFLNPLLVPESLKNIWNYVYQASQFVEPSALWMRSLFVWRAFGAGWGFWQLLGVWYIFSEERLPATTRRRLNKHSDRDPHLAWGKLQTAQTTTTRQREGRGVNGGVVRRTVKVLCLRLAVIRDHLRHGCSS